jgi:WD40 repeat protein
VVKQIWGSSLQGEVVQQLRSLIQQQEWNYPHLPRWLDLFDQEGRFYLVQNYIPGENLANVLAAQGTLTASDIWYLLEQLLPALYQIHQWGIIHGDIKPENIIRQGPSDTEAQSQTLGHLMLVDGSIASLITPENNYLHLAIGSPAYAAPEQLTGQPIFASDLYSLGVTCLHLLTGMHPFSWVDLNGLDKENSQENWRNYIFRDLDLPLAHFLDRLTARDLNQRLPSAEVALTELYKVRGKPSTSVSGPARSPLWACYATLTGHNGLFANINAVAIAPDSRRIASASDDKTVRLWNLQTGEEQGTLSGHTHFVKSVAFHPHDSSQLVSGGRDRTIQLWDLQHQKIAQTFTGHSQAVNTVLFNPDGTLLASGSNDKTVNLWDSQTGELLTSLRGHTLGVTALAFGVLLWQGQNQSILISASLDSTVRLWQLTTGQPLFLLTGHTAAIRAIALSPDGTWLATGSEDRTIRLWDLASRQCLQTLTGHSWTVSALAFAADGKTLISGSWDKTVSLWQMPSGELITTLVGHSDSVSCVAIAPTQDQIVSGSYDKTLRLWQRISQ